jgi:hypothetical protein
MQTETPQASGESSADPRRVVDPDKIRDRSRASGFDLLKTTLSLATASVGAFFFALTREITPSLTRYERCTLIAAILLMVGAVVFGIAAWAADALFYKRWADVLREKSGASWKSRERAKVWRQISVVMLACLFLLGVLAAGVFAILRVARVA